jgi:hypothetical protein
VGRVAGWRLAVAGCGIGRRRLGHVCIRSFQARDAYQRELDSKLVTDKKVLYKSYLDLFQGFLASSSDEVKPENVVRMNKFIYSAMLNSSDDVVRMHNAVTDLARQESDLVMPALAEVVLAMRRDAGLPDTGLTPIEILRPMANDIDEHPELLLRWEAWKAEYPPVPPR